MQQRTMLLARALTGALLLTTAASALAQGQGKLAAAPPVTYNNRYELYGGINFQNFQAGQTCPSA